MDSTKQNINTKMDWTALDRCWEEQYEEDYGNLFINTILNHHRMSISVSNIEAGMLVTT